MFGFSNEDIKIVHIALLCFNKISVNNFERISIFPPSN